MASLADVAATIDELRRKIPNVLQPLLASAIAVTRAEITADMQAVAKDRNDRALKEIERQLGMARQAEISTRAAADAQQVEISCLVENAANDKF